MNYDSPGIKYDPNYRSFTWKVIWKIGEKRGKRFDGLILWQASNLRFSVSPVYDRSKG